MTLSISVHHRLYNYGISMLQFRRTVQPDIRMEPPTVQPEIRMEPPTERMVSVNVLLVELLNRLFYVVHFIKLNF